MNFNDAFDELQKAADAEPSQVKIARERRDLFRRAFDTEDEVLETLASGSLARSTQRDPINDVDIIVVYDPATHSDWGSPGASASEALEHLQGRITSLLGTQGSVDQVVRLARVGNHAVKCFLDDPEDDDGFTVDVMPVIRHSDQGLLAPEKASADWIRTDPEYLIEEVAERQRLWNQFRPLVRVLKMWNSEVGAGMKSLTVEVLALNELPEAANCAEALRLFFSAAELAISLPVEDPAGLCGEIQPDIDRDAARRCLAEAASISWQAINAQSDGETDRAACLWRKIFGEAFPAPEGGCEGVDEDDGIGAGLMTGVGAGSGIGHVRERPVVDSPQG